MCVCVDVDVDVSGHWGQQGEESKSFGHTFWKDLCDNCQHIYWVGPPVQLFQGSKKQKQPTKYIHNGKYIFISRWTKK